jgi:dihydroorotase-like cyclic amidohydrolase
MGLLSMYTGCPIYIVHVSSKESVEAIKYLRGKGIRLYAETCPHYLTLNRYTDMGVLARVEPPLRDDEDIAYLWRAVMDNTFDTIGSDHVPLMKQQKMDDGIWKGTGGIGGIGAILAIMMTEGYHKGKITIERIAKITSENAARIWGIYPQKGVLLPGSDADIVIVDPNSEWTLSADSLQSRSDYSVFEGKKVRGKAVKTFVRGKLVAADGKLVTNSPSGKFVYPVNIK